MTLKKNSKKSSAMIVDGGRETANECIWMKAGLVEFRQCDNAFDCGSCPFDTGMRKKMQKGSIPRTTYEKSHLGEALFLRYRGNDLPCRHSLTGRIEVMKQCPNAYECNHCEYDQWLDEQDETGETLAPVTLLVKGRFKIADTCYYHPGHMWARIEHGGKIRIGFDDFLLNVSGPIEGVNLPGLGSKISEGEVHFHFSIQHQTASVQSPVTGTVLAINHRAIRHPDIISDDPYRRGWLALVSPAMPKTCVKNLFHGQKSLAWMENEIAQWITRCKDSVHS